MFPFQEIQDVLLPENTKLYQPFFLANFVTNCLYLFNNLILLLAFELNVRKLQVYRAFHISQYTGYFSSHEIFWKVTAENNHKIPAFQNDIKSFPSLCRIVHSISHEVSFLKPSVFWRQAPCS